MDSQEVDGEAPVITGMEGDESIRAILLRSGMPRGGG